ncbi:MAG: hypothetical protein K9N46_08270 [Candidatus Marinimicrobia bacterium]|nr:hypothetical protein [Candidatus Neomarinimicrobiota bacterium]MCF7828802.1 hypothetical protein [Candidatus Neomarinimicrobiota bacterium]MCF7880719.1 hypothetical protein [Candidatus Neomarinimicrobiota bacterium]
MPDYVNIIIWGVYALQVVELIFLPLPSEVSTYRLLSGRSEVTERDALGIKPFTRGVLILGTVISVITFLIPFVIQLYPDVLIYLLPITVLVELSPALIGVVLLVLGSLLTLTAVIQISKFRSKNEMPLFTSGIYGFSRNPITLGLDIIMVGFFLVYPTWVLLGGTVIYLMNSHYHVVLEEAILRERLGDTYRRYAGNTRRYL